MSARVCMLALRCNANHKQLPVNVCNADILTVGASISERLQRKVGLQKFGGYIGVATVNLSALPVLLYLTTLAPRCEPEDQCQCG